MGCEKESIVAPHGGSLMLAVSLGLSTRGRRSCKKKIRRKFFTGSSFFHAVLAGWCHFVTHLSPLNIRHVA